MFRRATAILAILVGLLIPTAAYASTGCNAVNAGKLDQTTVFAADNTITSTNARQTIGTSSTLQGLKSPSATPPFSTTRFDAVDVDWDAGDVLNVTFTITPDAGSTLKGFLDVSTSPTTLPTVYSTSTTASTTYTLLAGTMMMQTRLVRFSTTVPGGFASGTVSVSVTCTPVPVPPTISTIIPNQGSATSPASITITGTNFSASGNSVTFGGSAGIITSEGSTSITVTPPAHAAGAVDVVVTNAGALSATAIGGYTYVAAPTVTSISPATGPPGGGTSVTITGTDFTGATAVSFGGTAASSFIVNNATSISATSPAGSGTVDIRVTAPGGTSATGASDQFTYNPPLTTTVNSASVTGTVGAALTAVTPVSASGGVGTISYALSGGTLPAGLSFDTSNGQLSGTPTAALSVTSFTVTATDSASPTAQTSAKNFNLTIAKANQTITFGALSDASLSSSPLTLSATSSSGLTVAFSSSTTSVCTVSGTTLNLLTTGTCTIDADQAGDSNYNAATTVTHSFTVLPATLTITPGAASGTQVGGSYSQSNSGGGGLAPYTFSVSSGAVPAGTSLNTSTGAVTGTPTTAGPFSYQIQVADSQATPATAVTSAISGTIAKGDQTITFNALPNAAISDSPLTLSATASSGLAVTFSSSTLSVCTVSGTTLTLLTTGTCTVAADQAGNANYNAAPSVPRSFTVLPPALAVTSDAPSGAKVGGIYSQSNYGTGGVPPYNFTIASGALPPGTSLNSSTGAVTGTPTTAGAFSYQIQATDSDGPPVTASGSAISGTIAKGDQTISFTSTAPANVPVGGSAYTPTATATSGLAVTITIDSSSSSICTLSGGAVSFVAIGTCKIDANQGGNSNYNPAPQVQQQIAVGYPAPTVANRSGIDVPYDSPGTDIDLSGSITGVHDHINVASGPSHGTATVSGDVVAYKPTAGYFGPDSFTYTATGPGGTSSAATVSLNVALPPAPTASNASVTVTSTASQPGSTTINLSDHVSGVYSTIQIVSQPSHGAVTLSHSGTTYTATYTAAAAYAGTDSFTFTATGPGGTSPPATVSVKITGVPPTAQPKTASTGDGEKVSIDLTEGATGAPFTGAAIVSTTPSDAVAAVIVEGGTAEARTYRLDVTPNARFGGTVVINYTLSNVFGASAPAAVTIHVTARPNPTLDPSVRAISDAQVETARRFSQSQVRNFMRRTETLHGGGTGAPQIGIQLTGGNMVAWDQRNYGDRSTGSTWDPRNYGDGTTASPWSVRSYGQGSPQPADSVRSAAATQGAGSESGADGSQSGERAVGSIAVWAGGAIDLGTYDRTASRDKISISTGGLSGGADIRLAPGATVGLGMGYGGDTSRIGDDARVEAKSRVAAAYGSFAPTSGSFVDALIGFGHLDYKTRREAANGLTAEGDRNGHMTFGALSAGIDRTDGNLRWSAYGRSEWLQGKLDDYAETGAGRYDLRFEDRNVRSLLGVLGARVEVLVPLDYGVLSPRARFEWQHEFSDVGAQRLDYADIDGPAFYALDTSGWDREQFELSLGARLQLPGSWIFDAETGFDGAQRQRSARLQLMVSHGF